MAEMTLWDDELCHTMRLSPETVAAALTDDADIIAELRLENKRLRAAFADAVGALAFSEARVAELRAALGPLANQDIVDISELADEHPLTCLCWKQITLVVGDVRRAQRALGEGGK